MKTNRREFLTGEAALEAFADWTHGTSSAPNQPAGAAANGHATDQGDSTSRTLLLQFSRRAMACEFQIYVNAGEHPQAPDSAVAALDLVAALEAQLTVFRPDSEVQTINREAFARAVPVEPRLFALVQQAVRLSGETAGAFDITSGPLSKVWGFSRRAGAWPAPQELAAARERVGSHLLELNPADLTVRFRQPGVEINLGAIGKGYALDRCAERLAADGVANYVLHGGLSSILARGRRRSGDGGTGWRVGLNHPLKPELPLAELRLRDQAMGTSGDANQFFHYRGRRYGHVLDPRTGEPAQGVLSATVLAPTAAEADALATAFFVLGADGTEAYCSRHPETAALLVLPGTRDGSFSVVTFGDIPSP